MAVLKRRGQDEDASKIKPYFEDTSILNGDALKAMIIEARKPRQQSGVAKSEEAAESEVSFELLLINECSYVIYSAVLGPEESY